MPDFQYIDDLGEGLVLVSSSARGAGVGELRHTGYAIERVNFG